MENNAPLQTTGCNELAGSRWYRRSRRGGWDATGNCEFRFIQVAPPNGLEQNVETNLESVAVAKDEHLKLDAEGGAQATTPRTRYLTTGIAVMLAATQAAPDRDAGQGNPSVGEAGSSAANGASGFRFVAMRHRERARQCLKTIMSRSVAPLVETQIACRFCMRSHRGRGGRQPASAHAKPCAAAGSSRLQCRNL
jgi:hypothetical protein